MSSLWRSAGLGLWVGKVKCLCLHSCCIIWNTQHRHRAAHRTLRDWKTQNAVNRFNGTLCLIYKFQAESEKAWFQQKHRGSFAEDPLPPLLSKYNDPVLVTKVTLSQTPNASLAFTVFVFVLQQQLCQWAGAASRNSSPESSSPGRLSSQQDRWAAHELPGGKGFSLSGNLSGASAAKENSAAHL